MRKRPSQNGEPTPKHSATERAWVSKLLARLTPDQRRRYESACMAAPRHHRSGKLYDGAKAAIAERIMYEDHQAQVRRDA